MKNRQRDYLLIFLIAPLLSCSIFQQAPTIGANDSSFQQIYVSPGYELGERLVYDFAGYSFQPIEGYEIIPLDMQDGANTVILHDEARNFSFYVYGTKSDNRFETPEDVLIFWMPAITENDPNGEIKPVPNQPAQAVIVDDIEGILVNITGQILGKPLTGQVVSFVVSKGHYLFVLGFSDVKNHSTLWTTEGQKAFGTLVSTVKFLK